MKVFFLNWNGYGNKDVYETFKRMKYKRQKVNIYNFEFDAHISGDNKKYFGEVESYIKKEAPDFVFSYNYFPAISKVCQKCGVKYVSWVYDNPAVCLYSYTLINSCNYVFVFDSQVYESFALQGIKTVYYLPLATAIERYDTFFISEREVQKWENEVSFVGGMYNDKGNFYDRIKNKISPYTRGYLEGIMASQMELDGINIIEESLTPAILQDMVDALGLMPNYDGVETLEYLYSNYVINRKITAIERSEIIKMIGKSYPVSLYTNDRNFMARGVKNYGQVDYYTEMPYVFKCSKINLNITLRSIQRGIPLRIMDIMGCGGFLLTNFQQDMLEFFVPGEDFVYYESRQDLLYKIGYYLEHEEERKIIADNGYRKVKMNHTIEQRLNEICSIVLG